MGNVRILKSAIEKISPWDGLENAWLLVGQENLIVDAVNIAENRNINSVTYKLVIDGIGLVHTHPLDCPNPSEADLRHDVMLTNFKIFGIVTSKINWFWLEPGLGYYTPLNMLTI